MVIAKIVSGGQIGGMRGSDHGGGVAVVEF